MSRWLRVPALTLVALLYLFAMVSFGRGLGVRPLAGVYQQGPRAVLTIEYSEAVNGFKEGDLYTLKVLKVRGTKIDWGFVRLATEED